MTTLRVASNNPHYLCGWSPCTVCQEQRKAEQDARDRHPAGTDLPDADWQAARPWQAGITDRFVFLDGFERLDDDWLTTLDHLMSAFAEVRGELVGQRVDGQPTEDDYSNPALLACIGDIQSHLRITMNPGKARAIALALSRWADRAEEQSR